MALCGTSKQKTTLKKDTQRRNALRTRKQNLTPLVLKQTVLAHAQSSMPYCFVVGTQPCQHLHYIFETDVFTNATRFTDIEKVKDKKQK